MTFLDCCQVAACCCCMVTPMWYPLIKSTGLVWQKMKPVWLTRRRLKIPNRRRRGMEKHCWSCHFWHTRLTYLIEHEIEFRSLRDNHESDIIQPSQRLLSLKNHFSLIFIMVHTWKEININPTQMYLRGYHGYASSKGPKWVQLATWNACKASINPFLGQLLAQGFELALRCNCNRWNFGAKQNFPAWSCESGEGKEFPSTKQALSQC